VRFTVWNHASRQLTVLLGLVVQDFLDLGRGEAQITQGLDLLGSRLVRIVLQLFIAGAFRIRSHILPGAWRIATGPERAFTFILKIQGKVGLLHVQIHHRIHVGVQGRIHSWNVVVEARGELRSEALVRLI